MQLNTGTPSLVSTVRLLIGDTDGAVVSQFSNTEITDALNLALLELEKIGRMMDVGWGVSTALQTSTTSQIEYTLPTDLDGRIIDVILEDTGKDLSSDTTATWTYCTPGEANEILQKYREDKLSGPNKYVYLRDTATYGIVPPPSTGGSNSIKIIYEAGITLLSEDTHAPNIPVSDHPLICYMAGITLLNSHGVDSTRLFQEAARKYPQYIEQKSEPILDMDFQIPVAGRRENSYANKTGFYVRK